MSLDSLSNLRIGSSDERTAFQSAGSGPVGMRSTLIGKDARIISVTHASGAEISIVADGQNGNTKFWLPVQTAAGKIEHVYLGDGKVDARAVAQGLLAKGQVSNSEAIRGNSFTLRSYSKPSADDALAEQMAKRVDEMLAECWRDHGQQLVAFYNSLADNTPEARRLDENRKDERLKLAMKEASASISLRVQRYCDGLISKSEALAGLPEFLANRVASLIDSTVAANTIDSKSNSLSAISAEDKKFVLLCAMNQAVLPSNIQQESASA